MKAPGADNARLSSLGMLASVLDRGLSLTEAGAEIPGQPGAGDRDRAFALHLTYGVLRWLSALEWLAGQLLRRPLRPRDKDVHRLILLGLFQLWTDASAAHAAINESAECARALGKPWAVGVINAVLRRFQREQGMWLERLSARDDRHAHPKWLFDALRGDWPDDWQAIVTGNNQPAPLWLRLRRDRETADVRHRLLEAGFQTAPHPDAPDALKIWPAAAVEALPGFRDGLWSVQDPAAQLAADLMQLAPGLRVLDACAAPGGKTAHMLEVAPGIRLTALDRNAQRLERVRENLHRLGFDGHPGVVLRTADASDAGAWWDGEAFQRILLDAPCTATGVIRRHPEIKWLRTPRQLVEAAETQALLLRRLWPLLDAGGILLYATCSVLKDENSRQIDRFVEARRDAEVSVINARWGRISGAGRQILPGEQDMDGFYYALLRKT